MKDMKAYHDDTLRGLYPENPGKIDKIMVGYANELLRAYGIDGTFTTEPSSSDNEWTLMGTTGDGWNIIRTIDEDGKKHYFFTR